MRLFLILACLGSGLILPRTATAADRTPEPDAPVSEAGSQSQLAVVLLDSPAVFSANFPDMDTFSAWMAGPLAACNAAVAAEKRPPAVLVQVALRKHGDPVIEVAGKPRLSGSLERKLRAAFAHVAPLRPPVCDLAFRFQTQGTQDNPVSEGASYRPRVLTPDETADAAFAKANLAGQLAILRAWAADQGLPLLSATAAGVDEKFAGVRNIGRTLSTVDFTETQSVGTLFYGNPDFWRGLIEMVPGNQLVGAMPALACAANGEIDRAATLSAIIVQFAQEETVARGVLTRLRAMIEPFQHQLATEIGRGIKFHERHQYDRAIEVYKDVLAIYPDSAWAHYERFFSTFAKTTPNAATAAGEGPNPLWDEAAPEIYRCNPLYETQFAGMRGKTMGAMFDRLTLRLLAGKPGEDPGERFGTVAEVAMHLEDYGPAAQIYWLLLAIKQAPKYQILPAKEPTMLTTNEVLSRFLYCLEKLGVTNVKQSFRGDFPEDFADLDRQLAAWRSQ